MFLLRCFWQSSILISIVVGAFIFDIILDSFFSFWSMQDLGIFPRKIRGLWGIFFSPFLHANFDHLKSNILHLWILLFVLSFFYNWIYWLVILFCIVLSGIFTWIFGSGEGVHLGASGLVFALATFVIVSGFVRGTFLLISVGIGIAFSYHFLFWGGLFPHSKMGLANISYASHWSGVAAGIITAFALSFLRQYSKSNKRRSGLSEDSILYYE